LLNRAVPEAALENQPDDLIAGVEIAGPRGDHRLARGPRAPGRQDRRVAVEEGFDAAFRRP
jgi:hypothetical protein